MSDRLTVATVTAALCARIEQTVEGLFPTVRVVHLRPGEVIDDTTEPLINVFLYQVVANPDMRNAALPARRADGSLLQRPATAVNLRYLVTFIGRESDLEPELLLGGALSGLIARPLLTRASFQSAAANTTNAASERFLEDTDLVNQRQPLRVTPLFLDLEDLTKLWNSLSQVPYALSAAWEVSGVVLTADERPSPRLPVRGGGAARVLPFQQPRVARVIGGDGLNAPITRAFSLAIQGERLIAERVSVRVGDLELAPLDPAAVAPPLASRRAPETEGDEIWISLAGLQPGLHGLQVRHQIDTAAPGDPPALRDGPASNIAPFALRPVLSAPPVFAAGPPRQARIALDVSPQADWEVLLLLNALGGPPAAHVIRGFEIDASELVFALPDSVQAGDWLVRVQVDGAESALTIGADGVYDGPALSVTS